MLGNLIRFWLPWTRMQVLITTSWQVLDLWMNLFGKEWPVLLFYTIPILKDQQLVPSLTHQMIFMTIHGQWTKH